MQYIHDFFKIYKEIGIKSTKLWSFFVLLILLFYKNIEELNADYEFLSSQASLDRLKRISHLFKT